MDPNYIKLKLTIGVIVTIGLYTVLYRENKFYRLVEHIFLGLASGWALVVLWTETLKEKWWDRIVGTATVNGDVGTPGYWAFVFLLPIGLLGYFVFSRKHNWLSRVPIGIILGLWSGQQVQVWFNRYGPQMRDSMKPVLPTSTESFFTPNTTAITDPAQLAAINANVYPAEALTNIVYVFTLLAVLSYFLFSFEIKGRFLRGMTTSGRWLLMIGFGAIFGSTVTMRFTLLIDRMYFIWIEWLKQGLLNMP